MGVYGRHGVPLCADCVVPPDVARTRLQALQNPHVVTDESAVVLSVCEDLPIAACTPVKPRAQSLVLCAQSRNVAGNFDNADMLMPVYLRDVLAKKSVV
jgi:tRNA A37 threonylcarbamoyladenosine modification protein TsaB